MNCCNTMNSIILCFLQSVILYYTLSWTNKKTKDAMTHNSNINNLAKITDIWNKADCCPFTQKHISKLFEQKVWKPYLYLRCEKHLPGGDTSWLKQSHKKDPTKIKESLVGFKYITIYSLLPNLVGNWNLSSFA